jgi:hypothetical protein
MRALASRCVLFGLLTVPIGVTRGQAACPPGTVPYGTGQGQSVCGPDNSQQPVQHQPPPQWANRWGAIATALPKGILGVANDASSQNQAERAALADCQSKGGTTCTIDLSYRNQCAAMVVGHPGYNVTPGDTLRAASEKGLKTCNDAGDTNCHVYYSACSLPVRIR